MEINLLIIGWIISTDAQEIATFTNNFEDDYSSLASLSLSLSRPNDDWKWSSGNLNLDNAYIVMNFHRGKMNEYLCYNNYRSNNVFNRRSGDNERVNNNLSLSNENEKQLFEGKSESLIRLNEDGKSLLDDQGSRAYKIWLISNKKTPTRIDNLNNRRHQYWKVPSLLANRNQLSNRRPYVETKPNLYLQPPSEGNSKQGSIFHSDEHLPDHAYYEDEPNYENLPPIWIDHEHKCNRIIYNNNSSDSIGHVIKHFLSKNGHQIAMATMTFVSFVMLLVNMLMNMNMSVKPMSTTTMAISVNNTNIAINDGGNSSSTSNDGSNSNASTTGRKQNELTNSSSSTVTDNSIINDILKRHIPIYYYEQARQFMSMLLNADNRNVSFDFT